MFRTSSLRIRSLTALTVGLTSAWPQLRVVGSASSPTGEESGAFCAGVEIPAPIGVLPRDVRALTKPASSDCGPGLGSLSTAGFCGWAGSRSSVHPTATASWIWDPHAGTKGTSLLDLGCLLTI